jgi:hypothetical protein
MASNRWFWGPMDESAEIAAKLIERLLADPAFRARFRRDPSRACREAGLESLAEEMRLGAGKAMHTLDVRESRSSLAGVMMAAAMEGMGVYEFSKHVVPHLDDLPDAVGDVLSRVNLPALPGAGSLAAAPEASPAALVAEPGEEEAPPAVPGAGGEGVAPVAPPPAEPNEPPSSPDGVAAEAERETPASAAKESPPPAKESPPPAKESSPPPAKESSPPPAKESPPPPTTESPPPPAKESSPPPAAPELAGLADGKPVEGATRERSEPAPAHDPRPAAPAAPQPPAAYEPVDPSQLGQDGTGGKPNAEALALLENENVVLDDVGVADIRAGKIDPRIVGVLTKLSQEHKIVVSCMCSDHSKFTAGGSISNHAYGRGLDIASIDGEIVSPGSALAREVSSQLSELDPAIRPDEIGSPFAINGPGYFTDAAHSNHIHVGFKQEITAEWRPPAELAASAAQPAAAPGLAAVAPAAPPREAKASGLFAAAQPGKIAAVEEPKPGGESQLFLQAVKQPEPAQAAAPAAPVEPAALDLAGVAGAYPGDDAPKQQIAAWMAEEAEKRGLPPQLPVMAALVESNLTNVDYGDADSLGYFQMRVSIWNQGEYAGYPDDPKKQIDWFLDTAERVKQQRISRGQSITDPSQFGEWIADVERPAEQYRYRYQERLAEANALLKDAPKTPAAPEDAPAGAAAPDPAGRADPIDPDQFGLDGTGGEPDAEALALLENDNVVLDQDGVADVKAGRIDPRVIGLLTKLSQEHEIVVSSMCSDHPRMTSSGYVSNHAHGRGLDVASIDGEIVSPGSALAREVSSQLSELDPAIRPDEIGSPFEINGPGYFTDAAHSNHIHVGFKQSITPDFELPAELSAGGQRPAAAPAAAPVAAVASPRDPNKASGLFAAAQPGKIAAVEEPKPGGESQLFLQAVKQPEPAQAAAPAAPVEPAALDLAGVAGAYPGDDAPKQQIAAWMAEEAEKRGLPPQLPVMAALVESNLTNVDYGDADSLGYFQMRVSIWNQGEYAGYPDDPKKQIDWFLDTAERVKQQRISRGQSITDPSQFGEWIADVERPAEQYRYRYQERLAEANALLKDAPKTPAAPEDAPAGAAAPEPAGRVDPGQFGMAGGGGPASAEALALLENKNVTLDANGREDFAKGRMDPRIVATITKLAQRHTIVVSSTTSDHPEFTSGGGSRSNHWFGRGIDIATVDGQIVGPGSDAARELASELAELDPSIRPTEVGSPWAIAAPGFFTDAGHQNHIHFAYDDPVAPGFNIPAELSAGGQPTPAAPELAAAAPEAAALAQPGEPTRASGLFAAARPGKTAAVGAEANSGREDRAGTRNSALFLKAITSDQANDARKTKATADAPAPTAPPSPEEALLAAAPTSNAAPAAPEVAAAAPDAAAPVPADPPPDLSAVPADYPGDDAGQEALAKWLAKRADKAGLPPELPVMAALVESGVRNLNYGDADSVGFFQMRLGIWNQGEYAGYPENPGLQAKWFIDTALAVKRQRIAAGDAGFGKDPGKWGEWIADVERPAEQYRGRYQLRLAEARRLLR